MNSEYVRFKKSEKKSIQKSFLTSQILLLDSLKRYNIYRKLRTEEMLLKIALKTKIEHVNNDMKSFEKFMPKTNLSSKDFPQIEEERKNYTLEEEIDLIKKKIAALNSQF